MFFGNSRNELWLTTGDGTKLITTCLIQEIPKSNPIYFHSFYLEKLMIINLPWNMKLVTLFQFRQVFKRKSGIFLQKLQNFTPNLEYLENKIPKYRAYSICQVELKGLNLWNYKGYITGELAYDLQKAVATQPAQERILYV